MFWVYILQCADGSYYTGHTDNLEKRMGQYYAGECDGYVATRRPVKLIWSQVCATRHEALSAEQQIKGWSRKKKEAMMRGDWNQVSQLAKNKTAVRPEPVEGHNVKSIHPSTSAGRTDLFPSVDAVRPALVEGQRGLLLSKGNAA